MPYMYALYVQNMRLVLRKARLFVSCLVFARGKTLREMGVDPIPKPKKKKIQTWTATAKALA